MQILKLDLRYNVICPILERYSVKNDKLLGIRIIAMNALSDACIQSRAFK